MLKKCEYCGIEYQAKKKTQKYCSNKCKGASKKKGKMFVCQNCGEEFFVHEWDYRWRETEPKYCGQECYHTATRKEETRVCKECGEPFVVIPTSKKQYCGTACACKHRREAERVATQGKDGYKYVWFSDGTGMKEHRYIMEKTLGRKLKSDEFVHHIDGNRSNNDIKNLMVVTPGEHSRMHRIQEIADGKLLFGRDAMREMEEGHDV